MLLKVQIKRLPSSEGLKLPYYASEGAACMDVLAALPNNDPITFYSPGERHVVPTGLCFAVPPGYEMQVRPRSGLAVRDRIIIPNAPGTVDSDYRGELKIGLLYVGPDRETPIVIRRGDRIAQLILVPVLRTEWDEVSTLDDTARGEGGFGSTGLAR